MNVLEKNIPKILKNYSKLTVFGLSPDKQKTSHRIAQFLQSSGYEVAGTYPKNKGFEDFPIYSSLKDVPPEYRKFVDVFRRSERTPEVVDEVLEVGGVEVLWLQLGIEHAEAEKRAEAAGIQVISNRCTKIEYQKYL